MSTPDRVKIADIARAAWRPRRRPCPRCSTARSEVAAGDARARAVGPARAQLPAPSERGNSPGRAWSTWSSRSWPPPWSVEIIRRCRGRLPGGGHRAGGFGRTRCTDRHPSVGSTTSPAATPTVCCSRCPTWSPPIRERLDALGVPLVFIDPIGDPGPGHTVDRLDELGRRPGRHRTPGEPRPPADRDDRRHPPRCCAPRRDWVAIAPPSSVVASRPDPDLLRFGDHFPPKRIRGGRWNCSICPSHRPPSSPAPTYRRSGHTKRCSRVACGSPKTSASSASTTPAACDWVTPSLTSVRQRLVDMARMAVNLVQERGGEAGEATRVELATSLVVRDSTAPPAG